MSIIHSELQEPVGSHAEQLFEELRKVVSTLGIEECWLYLCYLSDSAKSLKKPTQKLTALANYLEQTKLVSALQDADSNTGSDQLTALVNQNTSPEGRILRGILTLAPPNLILYMLDKALNKNNPVVTSELESKLHYNPIKICSEDALILGWPASTCGYEVHPYDGTTLNVQRILHSGARFAVADIYCMDSPDQHKCGTLYNTGETRWGTNTFLN